MVSHQILVHNVSSDCVWTARGGQYNVKYIQRNIIYIAYNNMQMDCRYQTFMNNSAFIVHCVSREKIRVKSKTGYTQDHS